MSEVAVTCDRAGDGWTCAAEVADPDGSRSYHEVRVMPTDLERLDPGASDPVDLVRRSFDLPVIARYFPEYERAIRA